MIAMQALLDPGDRVVAVTPGLAEPGRDPQILGAEVTRVGLSPQQGRWRLDLDQLLDAITPATRLLLINSPGNPDRLDAGGRPTRADPRALPAAGRLAAGR